MSYLPIFFYMNYLNLDKVELCNVLKSNWIPGITYRKRKKYLSVRKSNSNFALLKRFFSYGKYDVANKLGGKVLPFAPNSPDLSPSDYLVHRSMQTLPVSSAVPIRQIYRNIPPANGENINRIYFFHYKTHNLTEKQAYDLGQNKENNLMAE